MFDPFESRRCRDVRNGIGHAFVKALRQRDIRSFSTSVQKFSKEIKAPEICHYVCRRKRLLEKLLNPAETAGAMSFFRTARVLWEEKLFFELHEWLEEKWIKSRGPQKKSLQALILAAVAFEQHQYHRLKPAGKLAQKAISKIEKYSDMMPPFFEPERLIADLTDIDGRNST